jgi:DNA-binding transcriptional ArsR family regulator
MKPNYEMKLRKRLNIRKAKFANRTINLLAHPTRIKIINILIELGDQKLSELYSVFALSVMDISHHLLLMHKHDLLKRSFLGYNKQYSLNIKTFKKIIEISNDIYHSP